MGQEEQGDDLVILATVIGILHNTTTDRWHPIVFRDSPLPGGVESPRRLRSLGHHTTGFATREDALAWGDSEPGLAGVPVDAQCCLEWNGDDVPAMVCFYSEGRIV